MGALAATWLIWLSAGDGWQWWNNRGDMEQMGQTIPLGAVVYGSLILAIEGIGRMFWAIAQREKDIEKGRQEGHREGRQEGQREGRQEGQREGRQKGREELIRELLEQKVDLPTEILRELEDLDRPRRPPDSPV